MKDNHTCAMGESLEEPVEKTKYPTDAEIESFVRRNLILTVVLLAAVFLIALVVSFFFKPEIEFATNWIQNEFGLAGLLAFLFVSDTLIGPVPPDVLLLIVAKSDLREIWYWIIPLFGLVSTLAGNLGWLLGQKLGDAKWARFLVGEIRTEHKRFVIKYGFWAVVIGAMTPMPFSVTCWTAGFLKMSWKPFFWASLFRIPRFVLYYLAIHSTNYISFLFG